MKKKPLYLWSIVVILLSFFHPGNSIASILYNDGGVYDIDYVIDDSIEIRNNFFNETTTVNLMVGGQIHSTYAYENSLFNITGGEIVGPQSYANNNSQINMSGGKVRDLIVANSGFIHLSGGEVGWMYGYDDSQITISGGIIGGELQIWGFATITAGLITSHIEAFDGSEVLFSGGTVGGDLRARENGSVYVSGGQIEDDLFVFANSIATVEGLNFIIDGHPVFGEIFNPRDQTNYGHLTGFYLNGNPIDINLKMAPGSSIMLIPEPATLLLISLGFFFVRKYRS
jgi:hypothetical protein